MSGHNRWTKIKHKVAAAGAAKGTAFTRVSKEITVAARTGGGDPAGNFRLRAALDAAKAVNMPNDTVQRAIKRGTGELAGASLEEARYEGFGPHGEAFIVECLTDNKNRTAGEIRSIFTKAGGKVGEPGTVTSKFERKGVIEVKPGPTEDAVMEAALDAGADDVINNGADGFEVRTDWKSVHEVAAALSKKNIALGEAKARYLPLATTMVEGDRAQKVMRLLETLEECDDVQHVHINVDFDEATLAAAEG